MRTNYIFRFTLLAVLFLTFESYNKAYSQCSVNVGNDTVSYYGYSPLSCATFNAVATGTQPITYLWSNGDTNPSITVCDSISTTYSVTVTDSIGCVASDTVTVFVTDVRCGNNNNKVEVCHIPPGNPANAHTICISENAVSAHLAHGCVLGSCPTPSCSVDLGNDIFACSDSNIILSVDSNYTSYLWSDSSTAFTLAIATSGSYYVTVIDSLGCIASDTILVTVFSNPIADAGSDIILVNGGCDTLNGSAIGGISPYSFLWSSGDTTASNIVCDTITTSYTLLVTDSNGCTGSDTVMVFVPALCAVSLGNDTFTCANAPYLLEVGLGYISYLWSDSSTNSTLSVNTSGIYSVTVMDSTGCVASDSIDITVNSNPVANAGLDTVLVGGGCDTLVGSATGGTLPYSYLWSSGDTTDTAIVCDSVTTSYVLLVTDSNGCSSTDTVTIFVVPAIPPSIQCDSPKVQVCHIPQGNPSNAHTICVSMNALAAHLAHGDVIGPCPNIQPIGNAGSLLISPNPFTYQTQLEFIASETGHARLEIINMQGEILSIVFDGEAEENYPYVFQFNTNQLPGGIYLARFTSGNLVPVLYKMIILN